MITKTEPGSVKLCSIDGLTIVNKSILDTLDKRLPTFKTRPFNDFTGDKINNLDVIGFVGFSSIYSVFLCQCKCGKYTLIRSNTLHAKTNYTCGCEKYSCRKNPNSPYRHPLYCSWINLRKNHTNECCKKWLEHPKYIELDMGIRPTGGGYLARKDETKPFSKDNCFWATGCNIIDGKLRSYYKVAHKLGITRQAVEMRLRYMPPEQAILMPRSYNIEIEVQLIDIAQYKKNITNKFRLRGIKKINPRSPLFKDLTGKPIGESKILGFIGIKNHTSYWLCECKCGNNYIAKPSDFARQGSCGCTRGRPRKVLVQNAGV